MNSLLIGLHAFIGELGIASFIWVFVEMLKPDAKRIKRAKIAAILGVLFFLASWFFGGYYYLNDYGDGVKQIIKAGPQPWAHKIFTETKEHVFLFLPFLSLLTYSLILRFEKETKNPKLKKSILIMSLTIIVIGALMALMGYLISTGFRTALEVGI